MEDNIRQVVLLPELFQFLEDDTPFTWPAILHADYQIVITVLIPQKLFQLILRFFPGLHDVCDSLGEPYFPYAGIRLGRFQDDPGAGVVQKRRKNVDDILFIQ